jgi:hypothetical protein
MVKSVTKVYFLIIISLMMQLIILYFINDYLIESKSVKIESYDTIEEEEYHDYNMPDVAESIKVSKSKEYAAFIEEDSIKIKNLNEKNSIISINNDENEEIILFKWIHDRNMLVYASYIENDYSVDIKLKTYDVDNDITREFPEVVGLSLNSTVSQVELSTVTNIVYLKIVSEGGSGVLYKYNIMNKRYFSMYMKESEKMSEFNYTDKVIFEKNDYIYIKNGLTGSFKSLDYEGYGKIIGIDKNDMVYIAISDEFLSDEDEEFKFNKIIYSSLKLNDAKDNDLEFDKFKEIELSKDLTLDDTFITEEGKIFYHDIKNKQVYDVKENNSINYNGEFLGVNDSRINLLNKDYELEFIEF